MRILRRDTVDQGVAKKEKDKEELEREHSDWSETWRVQGNDDTEEELVWDEKANCGETEESSDFDDSDEEEKDAGRTPHCLKP